MRVPGLGPRLLRLSGSSLVLGRVRSRTTARSGASCKTNLLTATDSLSFSGCQFYLSCWYRRSELGVRSAIFFSSAAFAGSFGGLLAYAISKMEGIGGKPGWAWIFILEGLVTIAVAILSFKMVHDFPDEADFLSPEDRLRVYHRLSDDRQASAEHEAFDWTYLRATIGDWKTYTTSLISMGCGGPLYAFSLFLPTSEFVHPTGIA